MSLREKGYNTGTTEWISFNLETAQIEIANQKYWHSTVWPPRGLCNFSATFFWVKSDHENSVAN